MNDNLGEISRELVAQLPYSERGPQRNGIFALWLLMNTCSTAIGNDRVQDKNHRKRIAALRKRLSSLSLPPLLRKAITAALNGLAPDSPGAVTAVLSQLVAPVRDSLGGTFGKLIERAAKIGAMVDSQTIPTKPVSPPLKR